MKGNYSKKLREHIARHWNWASVEYDEHGTLVRRLHGSDHWEPVLTKQMRDALRTRKA
jgi:hypothetical protein